MTVENHSDASKKRYSREEEQEIFIQIEQGNLKVREKFIEDNMGLAKSFALSFSNKYQLRSLTTDDLIQEACLGLIKAVDRFDRTKGYKFSTYASFWIRQGLDIAILTKEKGISLGRKKLEKVRKIKAIEERLKKEGNSKPSPEELSKESNISKAEIEEIYNYQYDTISINTPSKEFENKELADIIPSTTPSAEELIINSDQKMVVQELMENTRLTEVEREVILLYFESGISYQKIGEILGFSRSNTKLKLESALRKFRMKKDIKDYAIYMDNPVSSEENIDIFKELYIELNYNERGKGLEKRLEERKRNRKQQNL